MGKEQYALASRSGLTNMFCSYNGLARAGRRDDEDLRWPVAISCSTFSITSSWKGRNTIMLRRSVSR
jgi:hypothetical protein